MYGEATYLGDIQEIEYVPSYVSGGAGGQPGSPQQKTDPAIYAEYMWKLRMLGYPAPDSGNAYDPNVRAAVAAFQQDHGLAVDGLGGSGSQTFAAIDREFAKLKASPPDAPVVIVEPPVAPPSPDSPVLPPPSPPLVPVVEVEEKERTGLYVALGIGAIVLAGGAYLLLAD